MKVQLTILILLLGATFAQYHDQPECNKGLPALTPGLTTDFQNWLNANGYSSYGFTRTDLAGGAYGGRTSPNQTLNNVPIIFYHGNSDIAVGNGTTQASWQTGFRDLIDFLLTKGYTSAELYITTWGPGNSNDAYNQNHNAGYVTYLRKFTEAVLAYTGATSFNVVSHSMGVTLARKVIKGGVTVDTGVNIGPSLGPQVNAFIGLAAANYGLQTCQYLTNYPTCAQELGFYPGTGNGNNGIPTNFGTYLADIAENGGREGNWIATLWASPFDSIIGIESLYGHNTSQISYEDATKTYPGTSWTHFDIRDGTCAEVLEAIQTHTLP